MQRTVFETPILRHLFVLVSRVGLWLSGWKLDNPFPAHQKYVLVVAPHTSNWDFPIGLALCFAGGGKPRWLGKHSLFKGPAGPVMRWLGGIPVKRDRAYNLVEQLVETVARYPQLTLAITPEGTRGVVQTWKTGFYHVALGAAVPMIPAYLDYRRKRGGFGPAIMPSGNMDQDLEQLRAFYRGITPKRAENWQAEWQWRRD